MKSSISLLVLVWLISSVTPAAAFQFSRDIEYSPVTQDEFLAIYLDSLLYSHTRDGFTDLRLVDREKIETPYLIDKLRSTRSKTVRKILKPEIISLQQVENNPIEIVLRRKADKPPAEGLRIYTPLTDFEHRVRVFGSPDGQNWHSLLDDGLIYDYSRFIDLSNRDVSLPANTYRWLKIRVEEPIQNYESENLERTRELQGGEEKSRSETTTIRRVPLRIDRIEYWSSKVESRASVDTIQDYPVVGFSLSQNAATKSTIVEVTTQREPLTALIIESAQRNFNRRAVVEIPNTEPGAKSGWQKIGESTLERIHFRALHRERLRIGFQEERQRQYRIVIRNYDNPPLEITGVRAQGTAYRLLFLAQPANTYALEYGDESAAGPVYDTASLKAALAASYQPTRVELGPEAPGRTSVRKPGFDFARWLNSDLFLGGVVFIVVVILAAALVHAGRRIERSPDD